MAAKTRRFGSLFSSQCDSPELRSLEVAGSSERRPRPKSHITGDSSSPEAVKAVGNPRPKKYFGDISFKPKPM